MSLTTDRDTPQRSGSVRQFPVAANVLIYAGALVMIDSSGNARPGAASNACRGGGRARAQADNSTGAAGDQVVDVEMGIFRFDNSASADAISQADIDKPCYIVDDATVAKTSNGGARSIAGRIVDVDDNGVWVFVGDGVGSNKRFVRMSALSNKAADAAVSRAVAGIAGKLTRGWSVLNAALATGDATLQLKINGVNVTGGLITVTQAGSAAGDVDTCSPTAANSVGPDDLISVTGGGASTATSTSEVFVEITY